MFILVLFVLIVFPVEAQTGAREGLKTVFETVIPSILPFSVAASAVVYSGMAQRLGQFFLPMARLMGINPYGITALLCSFLGGYPTGCRVVCDMYKEGLIDKSEGERMLAYANNGGLIFALNICGRQVFGKSSTGWAVFSASVTAVFITALILGRSTVKDIIPCKKEKPPFMATLGKSVANGGGVIINIASSFVVFYAVANALRLERAPFFEGVFEMTKGIMYAGRADNLPLAAFFFTIGGIGVFSQSAAICSEYDLSLKWYVKGRLVSAALAFLITYLISGEAFVGKDVVLFSALAVAAVICAVKAIKKLYASA